VRRPLILAVYLGIAAMWGSTWMVIAIGLRDLPPLFFAGIRMAIAALLLAPLALRRGGGHELLRSWRQVLIIGLLQVAVPYGLMFVAQQWVPSGLSAILFATFPIWIALVARFALPGERLTPLRIASVVVGVAGVVVLEVPRLGDVSASALLAMGSALIVLASIVVAFANVLARRHILAISPLALTAGQAAVGGVLLLVTSLLAEAGRPISFTPSSIGAVLYLAVFGSGLTYLGLYWLMPRIPVPALGVLPLVDTTVAVLLGALVLGEPTGWSMAAGGAMVLAAAALAGLSGSGAPAPRTPLRRADQVTLNRGASAQRPSRS
jgi:drug/metabolite transporter (DMT)-like permease